MGIQHKKSVATIRAMRRATLESVRDAFNELPARLVDRATTNIHVYATAINVNEIRFKKRKTTTLYCQPFGRS